MNRDFMATHRVPPVMGVLGALALLAACPKEDDSAHSVGAASAPSSAPASAPASPAQALPPGGLVVGSTEGGFVDGRDLVGPVASAARLNKPIRLAPWSVPSADRSNGPSRLGVLIADISNHAVRTLTVTADRQKAQLLTAVGGPTLKGHEDTNQEHAAPPAKLNAPHGVAPLGPTAAVIAEASNHTLRRIELISTDDAEQNTWTVTTLAGAPGESGFVDGPSAQARFSSPHGVCVLAGEGPDRGGIVIADIGNKRLRLLRAGQVTTLAGSDEAGAADGPVGVGRLTAPIDVHCDADGSVLIADAGSMSIRRWRKDEGLTTLPVDRPLKVPHSVAVDDQGRILVAELDGHAITEITGGKARVVFGTGAAGSAPAQLNRPADVLIHAGTMWIADLGNHQIKAVPWPQAR